MYYDEEISETLTLDHMGRVKLGQLNGIEKVHACVEHQNIKFGEAWNIMNESN